MQPGVKQLAISVLSTTAAVDGGVSTSPMVVLMS